MVTKLLISDFDELRPLGEGAFGKVILARLKSNSKLYAIKVINKAFLARVQKEYHVFQERLLLNTLQSIWVTSLHSAFQDQHNLYFMLDYFEHGDLGEYTRVSGFLIRKINT